MKLFNQAKKWIKSIKSIKQAVLRTFFIFISMPAVAAAGMHIDKSIPVDQGLMAKIIALIFVSLLGGVSSTFVSTSFDEGIKHPNLFKIVVGTCLGTFSAMMVLDNSSFGIFSIILPAYFVATLGAPLMVFYLMWLSNPETQAEIKEQITQKVREKLRIEK